MSELEKCPICRGGMESVAKYLGGWAYVCENENCEASNQEIGVTLLHALNRRAPAPEQKKPYGFEDFFAEAEAKGLTVDRLMADWKRMRPQDFEPQAPAEPVAIVWLHEVLEPNAIEKKRMLSFSSVNPWGHWLEKYRDKCKYSATPLYTRPIPAAPAVPETNSFLKERAQLEQEWCQLRALQRQYERALGQKTIVPTDWKLVPIVPTDDMKDEGAEALRDNHMTSQFGECGGLSWGDAEECYKAMIAASPEPQGGAQ